MGAEAVQGVDRSPHGDLLAQHTYEFLAVNQPSTQRALSLIANNEQMSIGLPQVFFQMMDYSTCVAHTCPCQNGTGSTHSIQPPRRVGGGASLEIVAVQGKKAAPFPIGEFLIEQLRMLHKNPAGLD